MEEDKSLFSYVTRFEDRDKAPVNNQWRSKKWGAIVVKNEEFDYLARFTEFDYDKHTDLLIEDDSRAFNVTATKFFSSDVVAAGIIAYWLYHRGEKDIPEIISDYYAFQKENYIKQQSIKRCNGTIVYEREFICSKFREEEKLRVKLSEAIFQHLNQVEIDGLRLLVSNCYSYSDQQIERYYPDYKFKNQNISNRKTEEESMIQYISKSTAKGYDLEFQVWDNYKSGFIVDRNDCIYRFIAVDLEDLRSGKQNVHTLMADSNYLSSPFVALGFVGYLLKHYNEKNAEDIYEEYYTQEFERYKCEKLKQPKTRSRYIEKDFALQHKYEEEARILVSRIILEYLPPKDKKLIEDFMEDYMEFVKEKRNYYCIEHPYKESRESTRTTAAAIMKPDDEHTTSQMSVNVLNMNIQTDSVNMTAPMASSVPPPREATQEQTSADADDSRFCFLYLRHDRQREPREFNRAIQTFAEALQRSKLIEESVSKETMTDLFGGMRCSGQIRWLGDKRVLLCLLKRLTRRGDAVVATSPQRNRNWEVVKRRFVDRDGAPIDLAGERNSDYLTDEKRVLVNTLVSYLDD